MTMPSEYRGCFAFVTHLSFPLDGFGSNYCLHCQSIRQKRNVSPSEDPAVYNGIRFFARLSYMHALSSCMPLIGQGMYQWNSFFF